MEMFIEGKREKHVGTVPFDLGKVQKRWGKGKRNVTSPSSVDATRQWGRQH